MSLQIEATPPVGGLDTQMVLDDKAGLAQRELLVLQPADHPPILAWEIRVLGPTFLALLAGGGPPAWGAKAGSPCYHIHIPQVKAREG